MTNHNKSPSQIYEGFIVDLLEKLASLVGFTYQLIPTADGQYGMKTIDGSWNGMIGDLVSKVNSDHPSIQEN